MFLKDSANTSYFGIVVLALIQTGTLTHLHVSRQQILHFASSKAPNHESNKSPQLGIFNLSDRKSQKERGAHSWAHLCFLNVYKTVAFQPGIIITGTTNNEGRAYGDLVMTAVQQMQRLILSNPVTITS